MYFVINGRKTLLTSCIQVDLLVSYLNTKKTVYICKLQILCCISLHSLLIQTDMISRISPLITFLLFFCLGSQSAHTTTNDTVTNTIQPGQSLTTSDTILSANGIFELSFFSPVNSTKYYLGIRYSKKVSEQNVVWVANREYRFIDSSVVLKINQDGDLVISDS